jgi:hypothetical protein
MGAGVTNKSKERGTETERLVVNYLKQWWPMAERRALAGELDKGDIINVPMTVVEVKGDRQQVPSNLAKWREETVAEMLNDQHAQFCMLVVRLEGRGVERWDAWMPFRQLGIPLYGEDEWARMNLSVAVPVLQHLHSFPSLPFLKRTESK